MRIKTGIFIASLTAAAISGCALLTPQEQTLLNELMGRKTPGALEGQEAQSKSQEAQDQERAAPAPTQQQSWINAQEEAETQRREREEIQRQAREEKQRQAKEEESRRLTEDLQRLAEEQRRVAEEQRRYAEQARIDQENRDDTTCRSFGAVKGSEAYVNCRLNLLKQAADQKRFAADQRRRASEQGAQAAYLERLAAEQRTRAAEDQRMRAAEAERAQAAIQAVTEAAEKRARSEARQRYFENAQRLLAPQPSTSTNCTSTVFAGSLQTHCY